VPDTTTRPFPGTALLGAALACGLLVAGCGGTSPRGAPRRGGAASTTSTGPAATTTPGSTKAPAVYAATYTDAPVGQPGYALVVNPGPAGSDTLGGVAVFQYQDGKEAAYFSFSGRAASPAPFTLTLKGDRATTKATAEVTVSDSIIIENCAALLSPAVVNGADDEDSPPAPASCTFTYKLAPGPPRSTPAVTTNLTATAVVNSGLLAAYLFDHGWQTTYGSDISLVPGTTYLAYDPATGLDWAYATFTYRGPQTDTSGSPDVAMQDGGEAAIFYQIPGPATASSADDGWVMVGSAGEPRCFAETVVPRSVTSLWGFVDPPACTSTG